MKKKETLYIIVTSLLYLSLESFFYLKRKEKIEYRPVSVRELLTEIKDLSEIMIDLAYSSALFHSHELAEEVLELEERVDTLSFILNMNIMLAARDAEDAESLVGVAAVAAAVNKISDAAADIAAIVLQEIGIHPIVREAFDKVEERLAIAQVKTESNMARKKLGELELAAEIGVDVIAIRRGKEWMINPGAEIIVKKGDTLIVRGAPEGVKNLRDLAGGTIQRLE